MVNIKYGICILTSSSVARIFPRPEQIKSIVLGKQCNCKNMASAEREAIVGSWDSAPSGVQG